MPRRYNEKVDVYRQVPCAQHSYAAAGSTGGRGSRAAHPQLTAQPAHGVEAALQADPHVRFCCLFAAQFWDVHAGAGHDGVPLRRVQERSADLPQGHTGQLGINGQQQTSRRRAVSPAAALAMQAVMQRALMSHESCVTCLGAGSGICALCGEGPALGPCALAPLPFCTPCLVPTHLSPS